MASRLQLCEHCNFFIRAEPICPFCQQPTALYQPPGITERLKAWLGGRQLLKLKTPEQLERERQEARQRAIEASTRATYGGASYNMITIRETHCVKCGECVEVCPNQVFTMHPQTREVSIHNERCRSSFSCRSGCPTRAIVLYNRSTGVLRDKPFKVSASFETTTPGVYLIEAPVDFTPPQDAIHAARAAIAHISPQAARPEEYDVVVLGASLGGLAASLAAREGGLRCLILDPHLWLTSAALLTRGAYPRFFQEPLSLPLGLSLHPQGEDTAAQLLATFGRLILAHDLKIKWGQQVSAVRRLSREELEAVGASPYRDDQSVEPRGFELTTKDGKKIYAANVIFGGSPLSFNQPDCPGADARHPITNEPLVLHERPGMPTLYKKKRCLVNGGSEKAVRLALELAESGARVVLVHRRDRFDNLRRALAQTLWKSVREKRLTLYLSATLQEITTHYTTIQHQRGAARAVAGDELISTGAPGELRLETEAVFALLGSRPTERILKELEVEFA